MKSIPSLLQTVSTNPFMCKFYLQVYVRIGEEEWNVYRRYSHFHELHIRLRKKFPVVDTFNFPPKRVMGNKVYFAVCN